MKLITLGIDLGGPENRASQIDAVLSQTMRIAAAVRDADYDNGSRPWINPIFIVPGSIKKPDFEGIKVGHFSRARKGLVVMIAVPVSAANGHRAVDFVIVSLRDAIALAASYFSKKDIEFPRSEADALVDTIETRLRSTTE